MARHVRFRLNFSMWTWQAMFLRGFALPSCSPF